MSPPGVADHQQPDDQGQKGCTTPSALSRRHKHNAFMAESVGDADVNRVGIGSRYNRYAIAAACYAPVEGIAVHPPAVEATGNAALLAITLLYPLSL